jgi:hypothetical protein
MACNNLSSTRETQIQAKITQLESTLEKAYAAYDGALDAGGVESFKFDSGEASQWAKYANHEQLRKNIEWLESRIDSLTRKLNGRSNVILGLRRKYNTYYGRRSY